MADSDIRRSSLDGIKRMRAEGLTTATPADAPEIELDEDFWRSAQIVSTPRPARPRCIYASTRRPSRSSVPQGKDT